jgi:hypothetical protein
MISSKSFAYSSMIRRASSERDSLVRRRLILSRGRFLGRFHAGRVGADPYGFIELNQLRILRNST